LGNAAARRAPGPPVTEAAIAIEAMEKRKGIDPLETAAALREEARPHDLELDRGRLEHPLRGSPQTVPQLARAGIALESSRRVFSPSRVRMSPRAGRAGACEDLLPGTLAASREAT